MPSVAEVQKTFEQFKKAFTGAGDQLDACLQLMTQLKIALLDFSSLPPAATDGSATAQQELTLAREILEHGALLSIKTMDIPSFERYVAQLKVYYTDCAAHLPESQRQFPILGLNLLRLLAQNRIAEFHTELEQIPMALQHSNVYIKFPAQLEQHIMEGSYNKVLSAKQDGQYAKEGMFFMDMLVDTVRDEIAECSEKAYSSIKLADLQALLMLGSEAELREFAETRGWATQNGSVTFSGASEKMAALPASQMIQQTLSYAKELERIVVATAPAQYGSLPQGEMDDGKNQGIQKLLQAESEAAEAIRIAREAKVVRLKQAKAEAEVEIAAYKAQREEQFQALAKLRTGDSGVHQKAVAIETEKELASVSAKVAANKGAMIESLLKSVTTVAN